jgi:hypothetical protein
MAEASNYALFFRFSDLSCMHWGGADKEECKLYDAEVFGRYINITSGCEYGQ